MDNKLYKTRVTVRRQAVCRFMSSAYRITVKRFPYSGHSYRFSHESSTRHVHTAEILERHCARSRCLTMAPRDR